MLLFPGTGKQQQQQQEEEAWGRSILRASTVAHLAWGQYKEAEAAEILRLGGTSTFTMELLSQLPLVCQGLR